MCLPRSTRCSIPEIVVLRNDSPARLAEGLPTEIRVAKGSIDAPVELVENGVRFRADLLGGQKPVGSSTSAPIVASWLG